MADIKFKDEKKLLDRVCFEYTILKLSSCFTQLCTRSTKQRHVKRDILIEHYFHMGIGYSEILFLGLMHGCFLTIRQLKRVLKRRGMGRRRNRTDPGEVIETIERELSGSGSTIG